MTPRVKTKMWVQAQVRLCDQAFIPFMVLKKGDPDAGVVLLKLNRLQGGCTVYTQTRTLDGEPAWRIAIGAEPVSDSDADDYIARQQKYDSDLWVVEVEDSTGGYELDGELLD